MTDKRAVRSGLVGLATAVGLFAGPAALAFADPDAATPSPSPTTTAAPAPSTAVAAAPAGPKALPQTTAPAPTIDVAGGAAAGAVAAAGATTAAAAQGQGDVLDQLAAEYAVGAGGGQLSNLLKTSLKMRAMGFKPSKPYLDEIKDAMAHRPNQLPLIGALKDTIAYQQKIQAQMQILQSAQGKTGMGTGAGSAPGPSNPANVVPQQAAAAPAGQPAAAAPVGQPAAAAPPVITPATP